jgi:glucose-1-phosphatase
VSSDRARTIEVVLFDVGGVLVQLSGIATLLQWMGDGATEEQMWRTWLRSDSVRKFETGRSAAADFAAGVVAEFGLKIPPQEFLASFSGWPTGLYPGTLEMLSLIPKTYRRAMLSNSNVLHWNRMMLDMKLGPAFEHHFSSHLTGRIKPDTEAFAHVTESLRCRPDQVVFLDDNALNVESAQAFGMQAIRVKGAAEARRALVDFGIIDDATLNPNH